MAVNHEDGEDGKNPGAFAKASPDGTTIAFIRDRALQCSRISRPRSVHINTPVTLRPAEITSVQWNDDGDRILVVSTDGAEVFDATRNERTAICRLANGSGGLGQLSSVNFVSNRQLLSVWEFGKARIWDLETGAGDDLPDLKTTCDGPAWRLRPGSALVALLSRTGPEDHLSLLLLLTTAPPRLVSSAKLPTADAQSLSWSPDGHWLAVRDTASAWPHLHILTPDGHPYRSHPRSPPPPDDPCPVPGITSLSWSPDSRLLALSRPPRLDLLNTRTFSPLHTLDLPSSTIPPPPPPHHRHPRIPVFHESITAAGLRTFTSPPLPVSLPIPPNSPITLPSLSTPSFSPSSALLATLSPSSPSTLFIHHIPPSPSSFPSSPPSLHALLILHHPLRRASWHPSRPGLLLLDCGGAVYYLFDATASPLAAPRILASGLGGARAGLGWVGSRGPREKVMVLGAERGGWRVGFPEGMPDITEGGGEGGEEGEGEDSLFEILSNRVALPPRTEERWEGEGEGTMMMMMMMMSEGEEGLEDTFRGKGRGFDGGKGGDEVDPLDDSEIF